MQIMGQGSCHAMNYKACII